MKDLVLTEDELAHLIELLESNAQIVTDQISDSRDSEAFYNLMEEFKLTIQITTKLKQFQQVIIDSFDNH